MNVQETSRVGKEEDPIDPGFLYQQSAGIDTQNEYLARASMAPSTTYQQQMMPIPVLLVDPYFGVPNTADKISKVAATDRYFREPARRLRSHTRALALNSSTNNLKNNTAEVNVLRKQQPQMEQQQQQQQQQSQSQSQPQSPASKFPASFTPRKAEKMSFEEKVQKWLLQIPCDLNLALPFVECYSPTVSSSSSFDGVGLMIDYGDQDLVIERQSHVITKLSRKIYQAEVAVNGQLNQKQSSNEDDNGLIYESVSGPLNAWLNNNNVYETDQMYNGASFAGYTENPQDKFYPELAKLLEDCH